MNLGLFRSGMFRKLCLKLYRKWTSRNEVYCLEDLDGCGNMVAPEVLDFYRMRIRDAAACDRSTLRLADFFENKPDDVVELNWTIQREDVLMLHRALEHHLAFWRELDPIPIDTDLFTPIRHMAVEAGPGQWDFAPVGARRFWIGPNEERLCLEVTCKRDPSQYEASFSIRKSQHDFMRDLWPKMERWIDANHYLRGQRFCADCRFLDLPPANVWDQLILPEQTRRIVRANTIEFLRRCPIHKRHGLPTRRGVLLHGPPGTGKTMIGRALAQECDATFILVTSSQIERGEDVARLFRLAGRLAPTILFFEDLDLVGAERHMTRDREVLGELLTQLDGIESTDGVVTVATTNDLLAIEPALKDRPSRFDVVVEVPALDAEGCQRYIQNWFASRQIECDSANGLKGPDSGLTGAQLQEICTAASIKALGRPSNGNGPAIRVFDHDLAEAAEQIQAKRKPRMGFGGKT